MLILIMELIPQKEAIISTEELIEEDSANQETAFYQRSE